MDQDTVDQDDVERDTLHPRPQLVREGWRDLCGTWQFAYDDGDRGLLEEWYATHEPFDREIVVPFPPESPLSGIGDRGFHPVVWYRRTFDAPVLAAEERLLLHLGAVDYRASVWVNGRFVGGHEGGHTPFALDVTGSLRTDGPEQVVVVRAEDQPTDPTQPRGKQDWQVVPHDVWYDRTTGIWQPVWLERVSRTHIAELHWIPDLATATVGMEVRLSRVPDRPLTLRVRLRLGEELLAEQTALVTSDATRQEIVVPAARNPQDAKRLRWRPEAPNLVDAEVTLLDGGQVVDDVRSYLGMCTVACSDGKFVVNGRTYFLRMVLEQGFWPESHLAAPSGAALRREVELIKEMGFNGVRVHQKVEDPRFLYWCDRLGLFVWTEMPSTYAFSPTSVERVTREWLEVVRRDRSHPSVVTWVAHNESWGLHHVETVEAQQHYASALYHLTKALDPTRPVIGNDGWEHTESDIWGVHDYGGRGAGLRERYGDPAAVQRSLHEGRPARRRVLLGEGPDRGQPVVISEFGGLSYVPSSGERWVGYATVSSPEELFERFEELVDALLDSPDVTGFCYTQLTDVGQEPNGLLTEDRQPKVDAARIRAVLSRPSRSVPGEEVDLYRAAAAVAAGGRLVGDTVVPSDGAGGEGQGA